MNNHEPETPFERFVQTMAKLPPSPGLVFHGLPADDIVASTGVLRGIVASSRNPRVATENFSSAGIACIFTRSGRAIGFLSAHPSDEEVVLLPATVLVCVSAGRHDGIGADIVIFEEIDPEAIPSDDDRAAASARLHAEVSDRLAQAWNSAPVDVSSPGKFTSSLPF